MFSTVEGCLQFMFESEIALVSSFFFVFASATTEVFLLLDVAGRVIFSLCGYCCCHCD